MIKKIFKFFIIFYCFVIPLSKLNASVIEIGNNNAKIVVKVFSSLTCPHCASFHKNIYENLKADYIESKKVKI